MAVPKYKSSKARTRRRHSINRKVEAPNLVSCSNCGNKVLRHRVCSKCGYYRGVQVLNPEDLE